MTQPKNKNFKDLPQLLQILNKIIKLLTLYAKYTPINNSKVVINQFCKPVSYAQLYV